VRHPWRPRMSCRLPSLRQQTQRFGGRSRRWWRAGVGAQTQHMPA
jgi:hypothetical protein